MKSRFLHHVLQQKHKSPMGRLMVLTGARQTGKTTLARMGFPEYTYISLEDPVTRGDYARLTAAQWNDSFPRALLDEVQKEPRLFESIKAVYDQYPTNRYLLLGSSQMLLLQKVRESLAGRCSIFDVFPLCLPEMLTNDWGEPVRHSFFQNYILERKLPELLPSYNLYPQHAASLKAFAHYLSFGGYPAISDDALTDREKREWLQNYIRTYLERDIRDLADFRHLDPFVKLQQTTALLTGTCLNYSQLAREVGINANTAQRFVNYLEISYQTLLLKPWYKNNLKRLNKSPKLHYLDPGIQQAILRKQGQMTGHEYESAVAAEMYKQLMNIPFDGFIYHLRTVDGREVDLLIELEDGYVAIEIKMSTHVHGPDARHIAGLGDILDKPLLHGFVLSNDMQIKSLGNGITAMPAAMFLS